MFRIKICGLTEIDNARQVAQLGADAIGLNFYQKSPRYVSTQQAAAITASLPTSVVKVGLFVNETAENIFSTITEVNLDLIQLHGDEDPQFLSSLVSSSLVSSSLGSAVGIMKAFRINTESIDNEIEQIVLFLDHCQRLDAMPKMILLDAFTPNQYGGTGVQLPWQTLAQSLKKINHTPIVLAGGLSSENVAQAIQIIKPQAVDTSSGVESQPGIKDLKSVEQFIQQANEMFDRL